MSVGGLGWPSLRRLDQCDKRPTQDRCQQWMMARVCGCEESSPVEGGEGKKVCWRQVPMQVARGDQQAWRELCLARLARILPSRRWED